MWSPRRRCCHRRECGAVPRRLSRAVRTATKLERAGAGATNATGAAIILIIIIVVVAVRGGRPRQRKVINDAVTFIRTAAGARDVGAVPAKAMGKPISIVDAVRAVLLLLQLLAVLEKDKGGGAVVAAVRTSNGRRIAAAR